MKAVGIEAARLLAVDAATHYKWTDAAAYLARAGDALEDKTLAAKILRKSGDTRAALEYAANWRQSAPQSEAATEAYLRALVDIGDGKSAQNLIGRILPGTNSSPFRSVLYYLQSRLQKSDEEAQALLRAALIENADNSEALASMSDIQARLKDFAKARFYLKQAMAIDPDDPELEARLSKLNTLDPK
jgi:tetratricopeptide (TPR) repeat protein